MTYDPHHHYVYSVLERNAESNLQIMNGTNLLYNVSTTYVNGYYHLIYDVEFDPVNNYTYVYKTWYISHVINRTMEVFNGLSSIANITTSGGEYLSASAIDPSTGYLYMFYVSQAGSSSNITSIDIYSGTQLLSTIPDNIPNYGASNDAAAGACNGNGVNPLAAYG